MTSSCCRKSSAPPRWMLGTALVLGFLAVSPVPATAQARPDLVDEGPGSSGFGPSFISEGSGFSAFSEVRNVGTADSGGFSVSYYASTDTSITTGDHLLGTTSLASIAPGETIFSSLFVSFPAGIPDGMYHVGWIIDPADLVDELDESNNSARDLDDMLTVCNRADAPTVRVPAAGAHTSDTTPTFEWSEVSEALSYRFQVDDDSDFSSPIVNFATQGTNPTLNDELAHGTYYWRVRSDKLCGITGRFSSAHPFTVGSGPFPSCDLVELADATLVGTETRAACRELEGGPELVVSGSANVTLEAGTTVVLFDGFRVETGGGLAVRTCGQDLCTVGPAVDAACHSCAQVVCAADPSCCATAWDSTCTAAVETACGLTC